MKKLSMAAALMLVAALVCGAACAAEPDEEFAAFEEYGRVLSVEEGENGTVIEAEGLLWLSYGRGSIHDREGGDRSGLSDHSASVTGSKAPDGWLC